MKPYNRTFYIKRDKANKQGLVPVYCKVTVNGTETTFTTNKFVDADRWNKTNQFSKTRIDAESAIRNSLQEMSQKLDRIEEKLRNNDEPFTAEMLKLKLLNKDEPHRNKTVLQTFDKHQEMFLNKVKDGEKKKTSYAKFNSVRRHVEAFIRAKHNNTSDFLISKLDDNFLSAFHSYIKTERKISHNASIKYVHCFKSVIRFALVNRWIEKSPFLTYKMKLDKINPLFLTATELHTLEKKNFQNERLQTIKDLYLFSAYTSLAFADVMKLTINNIQEINGDEWLITKRTKTNSSSDIFLLPVAKQIIKKYSTHHDCLTTGRLFPKRSNQKTNAYLKEIADLCNINKPLNFHSARHTFGTTVTIPNGVPLQAVSSQMGHSNLEMTLHYARIQKDSIAEQMKKLNEKYPAR